MDEELKQAAEAFVQASMEHQVAQEEVGRARKQMSAAMTALDEATAKLAARFRLGPDEDRKFLKVGADYGILCTRSAAWVMNHYHLMRFQDLEPGDLPEDERRERRRRRERDDG